MKRLLLEPEQILATDTSFPADDLAFRIYYHVIAKGGCGSLPPIVVGTIESLSRWEDRLEEKYGPAAEKFPDEVHFRRKEYKIIFETLRATPYFILDGNHRALAGALNRQPIHALYIESDRDLLAIERMVASGELLSFPHSTESVDTLEGKVLRQFLKLTDIPPNHALAASKSFEIDPPVTMRKRAYDLVTAKKLPGYMIKNYRSGSRSGPRMLASPPRLRW